MNFRACLLCAPVLALILAAPAEAVPVTLSGTIINSCTLTVNTPGVLVLSASGTTLGSSPGGTAASLSVVAAGSAPTLTFGAPTLTSGASTTGATTEIAYTSTSGANQDYTASQTTRAASLIDSFSVHARVTRDAGFGSGSYTVTTLVTCAQP